MHPGSIPGEASIALVPRISRGVPAGAGLAWRRGDKIMKTDFSERRVKMVDGQIRTVDITSGPLIEAFLAVPREAFIGSADPDLAYIDEDLRVADSPDGPRYLMEPGPLARLIQLAAVEPTDRVLDVGAGTGYASAILSRLADTVVALESDPSLAAQADKTLAAQGLGNVTVISGPLPAGHPAAAPYNVIFIGGAVEEVPQALLDQLAEGGRLVAVEGHGNAGIARLFLKTTGVATGRRAFNAAIKPLPGFERVRVFEF